MNDFRDFNELFNIDLSRYMTVLHRDKNDNDLKTINDLCLLRIADLCQKVKNLYLGESEGLLNDKDKELFYKYVDDLCEKPENNDIWNKYEYIYAFLLNSGRNISILTQFAVYELGNLQNLYTFLLSAEQENTSRIQSDNSKEIAEIQAKTVFDDYRIEKINISNLNTFYEKLSNSYAKMYAYDTVLQLFADFLKMPEIKNAFCDKRIDRVESKIATLNNDILKLYDIVSRDGCESERKIDNTKELRDYTKKHFKTIDIKAFQPNKALYRELLSDFKDKYFLDIDYLLSHIVSEVIQNERSKSKRKSRKSEK